MIAGLFNAAIDWVDSRLPVVDAYKKHMSEYYAPKNFNFWYFFGVLSMFVLVIQLLSGVWLTMFYSPSDAFDSIQYIMFDVDGGAIIRSIHAVGASAFFAVIYIHMYRGLLYGSYKPPRELVWIFGMLIYVCLMAEGFLGYVLPWGNMSFWAAEVIISLVEAVPYSWAPGVDDALAKDIGSGLKTWVRGDFMLSTATVNKFMSLHVFVVPVVLLALVVLHLLALHEVGSNNPDGVEIKANKDENGIPLDGIPFHPYYTVHDLVGVVVFLIVFCVIVFFFPDGGGYFIEKPNYEPANALKTPEHIVPVWYYGPFYAMLRAIPDKTFGLFAMGGAIAILFVLPWLDRNPIKSIRYKGLLSKTTTILFALNFIMLGFLGTRGISPLYTALAQLGTAYYFAYCFGLLFMHKFETSKEVPERITGGGH